MAHPHTRGTERRAVPAFCGRDSPYIRGGAPGPASLADRQSILRLLDGTLANELASVLHRKREGGAGMPFTSMTIEPVAAFSLHSFKSLIEENIIAERTAMESYRDVMAGRMLRDPVAQRLMASIMVGEEKYLEQMISLLDELLRAMLPDKSLPV